MNTGFMERVREIFSGHSQWEIEGLRRQIRYEQEKTQRLARWIRLYMSAADPSEYRATLSSMADEYYDENWIKRNGELPVDDDWESVPTNDDRWLVAPFVAMQRRAERAERPERIRSYDQYRKRYFPRAVEAERRAKLTIAALIREQEGQDD